MESAGLRSRQRSQNESNIVAENPTPSQAQEASWEPREPPTYTIDLSLPPRQRYKRLAEEFKDEVITLPFLFDEVIKGQIPNINPNRIKTLAKILLRRVYDKEENEELKGIHEITGIDMYLLVAFNVLLDLFMGCTSGGVKVTGKEGGTQMRHFRTLDWGMPALRKVVVQLDFVRTSGGPVIASSVTYAGYVGVLTGVRKGMSMSLNFRPTHDASTKLANLRFYLNHLVVLLGLRPSISSRLRQCLLPTSTSSRRLGENLAAIEEHMPALKTTAVYLIFNDGERTIAMEKDHHTADVRSSRDFIVTTNHDVAEEGRPGSEKHKSNGNTTSQVKQATGMEVLVEESTDRKACMVRFYEHAKAKIVKGEALGSREASNVPIGEDQVIKWMMQYPITNEETHYAVVMDPTSGTVVWKKMYPQEMTKKMIRNAGGRIARRLSP